MNQVKSTTDAEILSTHGRTSIKYKFIHHFIVIITYD